MQTTISFQIEYNPMVNFMLIWCLSSQTLSQRISEVSFYAAIMWLMLSFQVFLFEYLNQMLQSFFTKFSLSKHILLAVLPPSQACLRSSNSPSYSIQDIS